MSILFFIAILVLLILSHELGHFVFAKLKGVKVEEFGFGFPPRLFSFKKGETIYSVNLLPLGGFVKIFGEDSPSPASAITSAGSGQAPAEAFYSKSASSKAQILSAGVLFNILVAVIIFFLIFMIGAPMSLSQERDFKSVKNREIIITEIQKDSAAERSGLEAGDRLIGLRFGLEELKPAGLSEAQSFIGAHKGKDIFVLVRRQGEDIAISARPDISPSDGRGALGIVMDEVGIAQMAWHKALWQSFKTTALVLGFIVIFLFNLVKAIFTGSAGPALSHIAGPVGIVSLVGEASHLGLVYVFQLAAFLSLNLAIINFLPFPALDGGRILFLGIEILKGSPLNRKWSGFAHTLGFVILIILMAIITYRDILRI
ncbi:MAG: site-2 protease family protein [Patescibacteria group bacterium]